MFAHNREKILMPWPYASYVGWGFVRNTLYARKWRSGREDIPSPQKR
jgi:hypothetical protein